MKKTLVFRVRATDGEGNVSDWTTSASRRIVAFQNSNRHLDYAGRWRQRGETQSSGKGYAFTTEKGASVKLDFRGRSVLFVSRKDPQSGKVRVFIDGALAGTFDLKAGAHPLRQDHRWRDLVRQRAPPDPDPGREQLAADVVRHVPRDQVAGLRSAISTPPGLPGGVAVPGGRRRSLVSARSGIRATRTRDFRSVAPGADGSHHGDTFPSTSAGPPPSVAPAMGAAGRPSTAQPDAPHPIEVGWDLRARSPARHAEIRHSAAAASRHRMAPRGTTPCIAPFRQAPSPRAARRPRCWLPRSWPRSSRRSPPSPRPRSRGWTSSRSTRTPGPGPGTSSRTTPTPTAARSTSAPSATRWPASACWTLLNPMTGDVTFTPAAQLPRRAARPRL